MLIKEKKTLVLNIPYSSSTSFLLQFKLIMSYLNPSPHTKIREQINPFLFATFFLYVNTTTVLFITFPFFRLNIPTVFHIFYFRHPSLPLAAISRALFISRGRINWLPFQKNFFWTGCLWSANLV